jgi:hypothetical protein
MADKEKSSGGFGKRFTKAFGFFILLVLAALLLHKFVKNNVITIVVIAMFILKFVALLFGFSFVSEILNIGIFSMAAAFCVIYAQSVKAKTQHGAK